MKIAGVSYKSISGRYHSLNVEIRKNSGNTICEVTRYRQLGNKSLVQSKYFNGSNKVECKEVKHWFSISQNCIEGFRLALKYCSNRSCLCVYNFLTTKSVLYLVNGKYCFVIGILTELNFRRSWVTKQQLAFVHILVVAKTAILRGS